MATKELTKRLLKGLGTCENCKFGIKIEMWNGIPQPTRWTKEREVYDCLKRDIEESSKNPELDRDFCEVEWEMQCQSEVSTEVVGRTPEQHYLIRLTYNANLLHKRHFHKKYKDIWDGAHSYLRWKEENDS